TRHRRFTSMKWVGSSTTVRTSRVARQAWSVIRGQIHKRLDRSAPELSPNPLVFLPHLVLRRVRRPVDACAPEVFETHLDSTVALIQGGVEFRLQARDSGTVDEVPGAPRQHP